MLGTKKGCTIRPPLSGGVVGEAIVGCVAPRNLAFLTERQGPAYGGLRTRVAAWVREVACLRALCVKLRQLGTPT